MYIDVESTGRHTVLSEKSQINNLKNALNGVEIYNINYSNYAIVIQ